MSKDDLEKVEEKVNKDSKDKKSSRKRDRRSSSKHRRRHNERKRSKSISSSDGNDDNNDDRSISSNDEKQVNRKKEREMKKSRKKHKKRSRSSSKRRKKKRYYSSSSSYDSSSSSSSSDDDTNKNDDKQQNEKRIINEKLLQKLQSRNETLEEREERRGKNRAEKIASKFGYTADDNPFRDPNLHEPFEWKKKSLPPKEEKKSRKDKLNQVFDEIEKVRQRRKERDEEHEEFERKKADQARIREQENYEEYEKKEEEFHLVQQRHRSAIRLVEGREKPIDVLAKNLLMFGIAMDNNNSSNDEQQQSVMSVKYKEKYSVWNEVKNLEAELQPPQNILKDLKLDELQALVDDIQTFLNLEKEANTNINDDGNSNSQLILQYWNALLIVTNDEIHQLQQKQIPSSTTEPAVSSDIDKLFKNKSLDTLVKMKQEIITKLSKSSGHDDDISIDANYWQEVLHHLNVHLAKAKLLDMHSKMLVHQLELLERRKEELALLTTNNDNQIDDTTIKEEKDETITTPELPQGITDPEYGNLDEELGLANEIELNDDNISTNQITTNNNKKPRYFNRVKTGYDWNKYNQTHYDHDNPPPKTVQGYKFNIFYPDLFDKTKTPQYTLLPTNSNEFCIIKFSAGEPYDDVAFKIINREWNKSRKRGFRCTFERGILSLYFNFMNYHYRK